MATNYFGGLFGNSSSVSSGTGNLSSLYSDYASIKNGSYKKLLKAYYKKTGESGGTSGAKNTSDPMKYAEAAKRKYTGELDSNSKAVISGVDSVRKAADALGNAELYGQTDTADKAYEKVSDFVNSYNTIMEKAGASGSTAAERAKYLTSTTELYKNDLEKLGITKDATTGKLTLNEETFKAAKMDTLKSLFDGADSYGQQIAATATQISSAMIMGDTGASYTSSGTRSSSFLDNYLNTTV